MLSEHNLFDSSAVTRTVHSIGAARSEVHFYYHIFSRISTRIVIVRDDSRPDRHRRHGNRHAVMMRDLASYSEQMHHIRDRSTSIYSNAQQSILQPVTLDKNASGNGALN